MGNNVNLAKGHIFGLLRVVKEMEMTLGDKGYLCRTFKVRCTCEDRTLLTVCLKDLVKGKVLSCGCIKNENNLEFYPKAARHPLHLAHAARIARCYNEDNEAYKYYGSRGIYVCKEWLEAEGFWRFVKWSQENGWTLGCNLELDREDNDGPYSPGNCRWVTHKINMRNREVTKIIEYKGKNIVCSKLWEKKALSGLTYEAFLGRLKIGWSIEDALSKPLDQAPYRRTFLYKGKNFKGNELVKQYGVKELTPIVFRNRVNRGWTIKQALTTVVIKK